MNEIRIASVSCLGDGGIETAMERAKAMIDQAGCLPTDLICLPELFAWTGLSGPEKQKSAQDVGGSITTKYGQWAGEYSVHLLVPLLERSGNRLYNSMLWLDRQGCVRRVYRKAFPTDYEMAEGISPGPLDFDVFQTEFGPVGCCICFDLNFREVIERLAAQDVRLVIFPTMFQGLALMRAWAKLYRMYFVSVAAYPYSSVVDPLGRVLVEPWNHDSILRVTLNLDYVVLHTDGNAGKLPAVYRACGSAVQIETLDMESAALLASRHPEKTARDLVSEFGLESECDYYCRSRQLRETRI